PRSGYFGFQLKMFNMTFLCTFEQIEISGQLARPVYFPTITSFHLVFLVILIVYNLLHSSFRMAKFVAPSIVPIRFPGRVPTVAELSFFTVFPLTILIRSFQIALKSYFVPSVFNNVRSEEHTSELQSRE